MSSEQQLDALFDLEKTVVFEVLRILGVELTPAEREAINQNRAENLLAFLAYGRGLQAMDEGDYSTASQFFNQSIQLDPGFEAARVQAAEAGEIGEAATTSTADIALIAVEATSTEVIPASAVMASRSRIDRIGFLIGARASWRWREAREAQRRGHADRWPA